MYLENTKNEEEGPQLSLINVNDQKPLEMFNNPKYSGSSNIGVKIGSFKGENALVGEDSALFKQRSEYTLVSGENLLVFRYPQRSALQAWPIDT